MKLSKTQLSKIIQSNGFFRSLLLPLMKIDLLLMKNVFTPLAKRVLLPLGLTAATSAANAEVHKKY